MSVRRERMDMDASREPGASIAISAVPNLRDLGGWRAARKDGHGRQP